MFTSLIDAFLLMKNTVEFEIIKPGPIYKDFQILFSLDLDHFSPIVVDEKKMVIFDGCSQPVLVKVREKSIDLIISNTVLLWNSENCV